MEVRTLGEFGLISKLAEILALPLSLSQRQEQVSEIIGIGDDCAVFPLGEKFGLITTDSLVENRHFLTKNINYFDLGRKSLAVSISDIAAMGGAPLLAVVNLQLPESFQLADVEAIYAGIKVVSESFHCPIVGGNTTAAAELSICTTVVGTSEIAPALRSGAKVGDLIWLSGRIGNGFLHYAIDQTLYVPTPRVELGQALLKSGALTSMIDVSDGLLQDAMHLAMASKVQLELNQDLVPFVEDLRADKEKMLRGGEDYELLFTASPSALEQLQAIPELSLIGKVLPIEECVGIKLISKKGDKFYSAETAEGLGWRHFSNF
jgi:thiamine-monophosphate kinase